MGSAAYLNGYLVIGALLFALGLFAVLTRRNAIGVLMGVELMLNAANLNLVAFSQFDPYRLGGQVAALLVIVLAVCEAAVALAIVLNLYDRLQTVNVDEVDNLRA
jgi:NADH:ubiquinone oxidoreductase subunit K|nr:MAG: NADH-quinone oxidoreductase subunit K [Bacteroidota bacterium]